MITDEQAESAADFIRDNATKAGQAKATRIYLEEFRKTLKARLYQQASGTVGDRESYAYGHPDYEKHLDALRIAVEDDERMRWMMVAAEAKLEAWRTMSANARRM